MGRRARAIAATIVLGLSLCACAPATGGTAGTQPTHTTGTSTQGENMVTTAEGPAQQIPARQRAFWAVIDAVQDVPDLDDRVQAVQERVETLSLPELEAYQRGYVDAHRQLYTWRHWGAATAYLGFVSDDVFFDLRGWVMLHGSAAYQRFEQDPDTLGSLSLSLSLEGDGEGVGSGELLDYVTHARFTALGGEDINESDELNVYSALEDPSGERLPDGVDERELFPRSAAAGAGQAWYLDPGPLGNG